MKRDDPKGSLEEFERLLREEARSYAELVELTGVSMRTAKERIRQVRRRHKLDEQVVLRGAGDVGNSVPVVASRDGTLYGKGNNYARGFLLMRIPAPGEASQAVPVAAVPARRAPVTPQAPIVPSNRARLPMHMPLVEVGVELMLGADDVDDVQQLVVDVAGVLGWPVEEFEGSVLRVFGAKPRALVRASAARSR